MDTPDKPTTKRIIPKSPGRPPKLGHRAADIKMRRVLVMELVLNGFTYRQIGQQLGISNVTAFTDFNKEMQSIRDQVAEGVEKNRNTQLAQINRLIQAYWQKAIGYVEQVTGKPDIKHAPDNSAARLILECLRQKAKLLDLDSPLKIANPDGTPIIPPVSVRERRPLAEWSDEDLKQVINAKDVIAEAEAILKAQKEKGAQP